MLSKVNEETFREEVLQSSLLVVVHFWAPWCGLCRAIEPMLTQLQNSLEKPIKLVSINADNNFKLVNTYQLRSLPTLLFFEDGSLQQRLDHFQGRDGVFATVRDLIQQDKVVNS